MLEFMIQRSISFDTALQYLSEGLETKVFDNVSNLEYEIGFWKLKEEPVLHLHILRVQYETVSKMDESFLAPLSQPGAFKDKSFLREFILASKNIVQTEGVN